MDTATTAVPHHERTRYTRTPYLVVTREPQARKDVYGSIDDAVVRQAQLLRGQDASSTVVIAMHPIGSPAYLPLFPELARTGLHVIGCATRYTSGDAALQMENVLLDLGACVADAKERLGYERVVLAGWSGGGSLMAGYQGEAEKPTITATAAGEPTLLAETDLLAADGLMLLAAPRSRHRLITEFLDASITDETRPEVRDREFDLYDPANPNQPPYTPEFVDAYRRRQRERNRRITTWARERVTDLKAQGRDSEEHCFVVHGTMADPRWLDPAVEPNGREPGWCYMGDPRVVNHGPGALARFTTTRSWLSQWGLDSAQVDAGNAAARISVPVFMLSNGRDDAVPTSHPRQVFEAFTHDDVERHELPEANHYFSGQQQRSQLGQAADRVHDWMRRHGFLDG